jgi:hypothetical protein
MHPISRSPPISPSILHALLKQCMQSKSNQSNEHNIHSGMTTISSHIINVECIEMISDFRSYNMNTEPFYQG